MKFYKSLFLLTLVTSTAQAGITKSTLSELSFNQDVKKVKVCGLDDKDKRRCDSFEGLFLKDSLKGISTLERFEILEDEIRFDGKHFAVIEEDESLSLSSDLSCELKLSKYRYSLKERMNAFAAGFLVKNLDTLSLYCEEL